MLHYLFRVNYPDFLNLGVIIKKILSYLDNYNQSYVTKPLSLNLIIFLHLQFAIL